MAEALRDSPLEVEEVKRTASRAIVKDRALTTVIAYYESLVNLFVVLFSVVPGF